MRQAGRLAHYSAMICRFDLPSDLLPAEVYRVKQINTPCQIKSSDPGRQSATVAIHTNETTPAAPSTMTKEIVFAILRAILLYLAAVLLYVHVLVYLKWETANADGRYTVEVVKTPDIPSDLVQWREWVANNDSGAPSIQELKNMKSSIENVPTYHGSLEAEEILEKYNKRLDRLFPPSHEVNLSQGLLPDGSDALENLQLDSLFQKSSLSNLTDDEVESLLNATIGELKSIADQVQTAQWDTLDAILFPEIPFPKKERILLEDLEEELCKIPALEEDEDEEDVDEDEEAKEDEDTGYVAEESDEDGPGDLQQELLYVQDSDLEEFMLEMESSLDDRKEQPGLYFANKTFWLDRLENVTDRLNHQIDTASSNLDSSVKEISEIIAKREYREGGNPDCDASSVEDVLYFLEAGLDALTKRQDVRDALAAALESRDPDAAENLILDADLATDSSLPKIRSPASVSLLKLLNSPILGKLTSLVDFCLDGIGGYIDPLDQFLDAQAEKYVDTYNEDASSLGKVFMVYALMQSGNLNIPIPAPLREFLESKPQGQALLAAFS